MKHSIGAWMVGLSLTCAAVPALGQSKDPAAADALFRQGREAMRKGDFATACPKLAESQRLDPAAGTVLNLAQCEEKIGKVASSFQHYQEATEQIPADDPRSKVAKHGLASTRSRVPKLTVKLPADAPQGTKVLRDDVELGAASLGTPLPVDPGDHVIVVKVPGRKDHSDTVSIREAETKEIVAALGEQSAGTDEASPTMTPTAATEGQRDRAPHVPRESSGSTQRTLGFVAGGLGIVGLGLGSYFWLSARSKNNSIADKGCSSSICPAGSYSGQAALDSDTKDAQNAARNGTLAVVAGGILAVGGVVLVLTAPSSSGKTQVGIGPAVGPELAGMRIGGAW